MHTRVLVPAPAQIFLMCPFEFGLIEVFISVKMRAKNQTFFGKDLVEWKIVSTFALAFEKSRISLSD